MLTIYIHDKESLALSKFIVMIRYTATTSFVGYSENGKNGPYKTIISDGKNTGTIMCNELARALFGEVALKGEQHERG